MYRVESSTCQHKYYHLVRSKISFIIHTFDNVVRIHERVVPHFCAETAGFAGQYTIITTTQVDLSSSDSADGEHARLPMASPNKYGIALFYNVHVDLDRTKTVWCNATTVNEKLELKQQTWPINFFAGSSVRDVCAIGFTTGPAVKHGDQLADAFDITIASLKLNDFEANGGTRFCARSPKLSGLQPSSVTIIPCDGSGLCAHGWRIANTSGKKLSLTEFFAALQRPQSLFDSFRQLADKHGKHLDGISKGHEQRREKVKRQHYGHEAFRQPFQRIIDAYNWSPKVPLGSLFLSNRN